MKKILFSTALLALALFFNGCAVTPIDKSGGFGAVTITNSSNAAIVAAAQSVFANYGYTPGPGNYVDSISFDKPAGAFGKLMYGSYGVTTTIRAHLKIVQIPGTNNYRLSVYPKRVSDAGEAGFEDSHRMAAMGQFSPLLKQIQQQASGSGS